MFTLFISDLHLSDHTPKLTQCFLHLLSTYARQADALYILGDLFELWIGDDDKSPYNTLISQALKKFSEIVPVYFIAGNRDFMLGQHFAAQSGLQLLSDPTVINLYGQRTLLTHGDFLCTQDKGHIAFRRLTQKAWMKWLLLRLPLTWRNKIAKKLRQQSMQRNKRIAPSYMDINQQVLEEMVRNYQVKQLIHGHTHRPSLHYFFLEAKPVWHVVLNDWDETGNVLVYSADQTMRLVSVDKLNQI